MSRIAGVARIVVTLVAVTAAFGCDDEPIVVLGALQGSAGATDAAAPVPDAAVAGRSADDDHATHECTEYEPVCGSDNMTYRNACQAQDAGVRVAKRGGC